jgi:hypothetical protein
VRYRLRTFLVLIPCVALGGHRSEARAIVLQGILHSAEFFGPPNYGENPDTDRLEHVYYLQLPASIDTQLGGGTEALAALFFVQLRLSQSQADWAQTHQESRVSAWGTLREWESGHQRTPQVLDVDSLAQVGSWRW